MSDKIPHDRKIRVFHVPLHRAGDVAPPLARRHQRHRHLQRPTRHFHQVRHLGLHVADAVRHRRVAAPRIQPHAEIHADDVAFAKRRLARNPVHQLLVDRRTNVSRKRTRLAAARHAVEQTLRTHLAA
jgi:hypothetical protein